MSKIDVWMLSRFDGKGLYALAFPTADALLEYVCEYYGDDDEPLTPPTDGDDIQTWLNNVGASFGYELAIDHDYIELP